MSSDATTPDDDDLDLTELFVGTRRQGVRRLPSLAAGAFRLVRAAAPRELRRTLFLQTISAAALALQVLGTQRLLTEVLGLDSGGAFGDVVPWLILVSAAAAVASFAALARGEAQWILGELVARHAGDQVLAVSTAVPLLAFESPAFHNRLMRAYVNAGTRPAQMVNGVIGILSALLTMSGLAFALAVIEPLFLVALLVGYLPMWLVTARVSRLSYRFSVEQTERDRRRQYLAAILSRKEEAAEIRAFGLAGHLRRRHDGLYQERIDDLRVMVRRRLRLGLGGAVVVWLLNAGAVGLLLWFVSSGRLGLAEAGAAASAILLFAQRLGTLATSAGSLFESSLFIEDFTTFVDAMPAITEQRGTAVPPRVFQELTVDDVSFTYPSRQEPALEHVSFRIRRGEVVALVGENGSGKTTLAKMLAGLYQPSSGAVRWDDVDLRTCDPLLVQDAVGVIFQDFVKYHLTARENIAYGRPRWDGDDDPARIRTAAEKASADAFLSSLRNGYETQLGAQYWGGSELSIGQWQRVAMARAFYRDAPFLILDEPTAALDAQSEADLFESIRDLYAGRTVLLISHRFSTVRSADRIVVLESGRVIEEGSHASLMALDGTYARLFRLQADAYLDGSDAETGS